ncbi:hypothetical protein SLNWT_1867 [Streptomyces albus]|uniref:Hydrogenase expression protein HypF n=2 Tax=Streptomyces TaxID=1883 RepID=A0A0B5EIZ2_STRA4|nr:hypothetical protein SLNWT_1867 [Streptomyces albus]AOU76560.1 hypothetical protein SLNHY_1869 [Streptomyces albus]AYN32343.1 hypothetical protein DUI70_1840 [Streptomyces albus]
MFNRFHVPAGKAMALAAMPTAVLMGMGLTPTLAQAKPQPKNPFQDGPCVTQPDEAPKDDEGAKTGKGESKDAGKAEKDKAENGKGESAEPKPDESGEAGGAEDPLKDLKAAAKKAKEVAEKAADKAEKLVKKATEPADGAEPAPEPSPSEDSGDDFNPWDPLGLGKALKDLFTPDEEEGTEPSDQPSEEVPEGADKEAVEAAKKALADAKAKKKAAAKAQKALDEAEDKAAGKAKDTADEAEDAVDGSADKAEKAGDAAKPSPSAEDPMAPDENGKKPFPCPVEKKVAGDDEQTPVQLPNQPWFLEASSLTLKGLDYKGVVNVKQANGKVKQALKFTVDSGTDIGDLHQTVIDPKTGKTIHVQASKGSTSTIRNGTTTMYTEQLKGNLFGLIPITFDPEHPPPINVPLAIFTNVKVIQAGQFGGDLTVPGLHTYITD